LWSRSEAKPMKISLRPLDWNLRPKIIFHVFVIGLIVAIILFYLFFSTQKSVINILNGQKAEIVGTLIEASIRQHMEEGSEKHVDLILKRLALSNNISTIRIVDQQGLILNSSSLEDVGTYVEGKDRAILHDLFSDSTKEQFFSIKSISPTQSFLALKNSAECFKCHSPDNKFNNILEVKIKDINTAAILHQNQIKGIAIAFFALVVLTFVIYRLFERIINRPLSSLKDQMKKVQGGNLSVRIKPNKSDEIGALADSFNIMVANLKNARDQIEELHNKEIERAGHLASMGELAAGLAHEIKNPIAGIKGALEVISQRTDASDPQKEIFTEILSQIDHIYHIVQDLLHYARPKPMIFKTINPNEYIQNAIKLAQSQTQDKDIHIHFKGFENDIRIYCDGNKIQEVILNLLINSISAIEEKGEISVNLYKINNKDLEIVIQDNGKGIREEHLSQVFTPFFTTRKKGTGLGLSICKRIIDAHKGSIEVTSVMGKETIFTIRLPLYRQSRKK